MSQFPSHRLHDQNKFDVTLPWACHLRQQANVDGEFVLGNIKGLVVGDGLDALEQELEDVSQLGSCILGTPEARLSQQHDDALCDVLVQLDEHVPEDFLVRAGGPASGELSESSLYCCLSPEVVVAHLDQRAEVRLCHLHFAEPLKKFKRVESFVQFHQDLALEVVERTGFASETRKYYKLHTCELT